MKILFVGDIHNHQYMFDDIDRLDKKYKLDKIICMGDYVDDWNTTNKESIKTLNQVIALKNIDPCKYNFCLGNHELSYLGYPCSGHQYENDQEVKNLLENNIDLFDFYIKLNIDNKNYYCSHAGFTANFIRNELDEKNFDSILEDLNKNKLKNLYLLTMCSFLRGGSCPNSSFVWADRREHTYDVNNLIPCQIVGHSPVDTVYEQESIYFIDTHSTYKSGKPFGDKSYLLWNQDQFEIVY